MKPTSWKDCPGSIQEVFLWDCDDLNYDSYESSKAEVIHDIQCDNISEENEYRLKKEWEKVTEDKFNSWCRSLLMGYQREIEILQEILKPTVDKI